MTKYKRIWIKPDTFDRIQALKTETGVTSADKVIRDALDKAEVAAK